MNMSVEGISTEESDWHPEKASLETFTTPSDMRTAFTEEPENAF
jgi:hypothetical protein